MSSNYSSKVERLKSRRKGSNSIPTMDSMLESTRRLYLKSLQAEAWESRASNKSATRYAIGAMQEVDQDYTRISIETSERIENQLSKRLTTKNFNTVFRLQGSVPLNIHIKGVSDVDLLAIEQQVLRYDQTGTRAGSYEPASRDTRDVVRELRQEVETALADAFPAAHVECDNAKSVKITGGSLSRDVDVVPSVWWDTETYQRSGQEHDRGVAILNIKTNEHIYNTPFLHIKLIKELCDESLGGLRKSIRLLKNIRADAEEDGRSIELSSFDIAAMMYHCDINNLKQGFYYELAILSETQRWLDFLWHNFDYAKTLHVPDKTRLIFDKDSKKDELLSLSILVDELTREIAKEMDSSMNESVGMDQVRIYLSRSTVS
ncbi:conserved hypothetical protein [Serratia proteamaculans]|uniref:hypothetical protein n=1 Tax=Serratia proteamaculans TaxID=28151 RepID=UPI0009F7EAC9|nr:hypothetical protein [Serratia proteamaculans]SMB54596.1 conserved hypothetical protein [Serratia proteamaculans]